MARGKQPITSFTAGRPLTLSGTVYAIGAAIPNAVVARLRKADALISKRVIIPSNQQFPRKSGTGGKVTRDTPVSLNPTERRNLGA